MTQVLHGVESGQFWEFRSATRGYALWLEWDLLGDRVLVRRWWGLGSRRGGMKVEPMPDEQQVWQRVASELKRRLRRGYALVDTLPLPCLPYRHEVR